MRPKHYTATLSLRTFVESVAEEHPPLSLDDVDLTVHDPDAVRTRYGHVFAYLTRVELEVERLGGSAATPSAS